jgi:hypothetical protein
MYFPRPLVLAFTLVACSRAAPSTSGASETTSSDGTEAEGGGEAVADSAEPPRFDNPLQRCRIEPDYNRCIVEQLDGHADSEGELIALTQSQRIVGDVDGAMQNMTLFVERYPDSPQAATYREFLESN